MVWWKALLIWHRIGILGVAAFVCLVMMHLNIWRPMNQSIEVLQLETSRLDQESRGLIQKIGSLKGLERDVAQLRKNLSSRVQQFPKNIELKSLRRDVMEIAKRGGVTVRVWKPEVPLMGLQHSETSIPITVRIEGDFQGTVKFFDELRQLSWVQSIASLVMARRQGSGDLSIIITNIAIDGLTPLGIEHVKKLLEA